jgi:CDP-diacylglycerol--serine O-phosphatidyltransferase
MVSFGAAPALISYVWSFKGLGRWGWIAAFVYCACAALQSGAFQREYGQWLTNAIFKGCLHRPRQP